VVYLFHGFFVPGAEFAGFQPWAQEHMPLAWMLTTAPLPCSSRWSWRGRRSPPG
jgi:hypothetical protein